MADPQRTEQPTKRRLEKSRKEGQFAISREFVSAVQFLAFAWMLASYGGGLSDQGRLLTRAWFRQAFSVPLTRGEVIRLYREAMFAAFVPVLLGGTALMTVSFVAQMGTTRLGFSANKLAPDFTRLNPLKKLRDFPKQGMAAASQALLLLPLFGFVVYRIARHNVPAYLSLTAAPLASGLEVAASSYRDLIWKAAMVLFLVGAVDLVRQRKRHAAELRMTKQEVKDESKESEGNPQIKQRVRRIQRDLARRVMMKEVPKATAVIVNPTHYAVAIRYEMETMAAPRVVAKGRNYLARRIREIAISHQVPIVENQPLAQALYKSAEVGQEIPPHLYRAVAEILAYLFKLMNPRAR